MPQIPPIAAESFQLPNIQLATKPCPCGSGNSLANCCLRYIQGDLLAPTAEALMRSRYTAHCLLAIDYLWDTWDKKARKAASKAEIHAWAASCDWQSLQILATEKGMADDTEGLVSFSASFHQAEKLHQHKEISLFKRINHRWIYVTQL